MPDQQQQKNNNIMCKKKIRLQFWREKKIKAK